MGSNAVAAPPSQCSSSSLPASPSATATMRAWSTSMTDRNYQVERLSGEGDRIRSEREDWVTGSPHCRRATTGASAGTETSHERLCDDLGRRRAGPDRHIGAIESRRSVRSPAMGTPWDAQAYDRPDAPQRAWAADVLARRADLAPDATVLDVGCETARVTEALLELMPRGRVLALDASPEMVTLARRRLGGRAEVWCQDVLDLDLAEPVDAVVSTAALHWVGDHDRLWARLAPSVAARWPARSPVRRTGQPRPRPPSDRRGRSRPRARARGLVAVGLRGIGRDRAAPAGCRLHRDPLLAAGAPDGPTGPGRLRAHIDPAAASCAAV